MVILREELPHYRLSARVGGVRIARHATLRDDLDGGRLQRAAGACGDSARAGANDTVRSEFLRFANAGGVVLIKLVGCTLSLGCAWRARDSHR